MGADRIREDELRILLSQAELYKQTISDADMQASLRWATQDLGGGAAVLYQDQDGWTPADIVVDAFQDGRHDIPASAWEFALDRHAGTSHQANIAFYAALFAFRRSIELSETPESVDPDPRSTAAEFNARVLPRVLGSRADLGEARRLIELQLAQDLLRLGRQQEANRWATAVFNSPSLPGAIVALQL